MKSLIIGILATLTFALAAADVATIQPGDLAARLAGKRDAPAMFHVGPNLLYRTKHIPGSIYTGMASKPDGIEALKAAVSKLPRNREIVLYCGCCPWKNCPNVKPALDALRAMGFSNVKAMMVETNFATDWTGKGYPVEAGTQN